MYIFFHSMKQTSQSCCGSKEAKGIVPFVLTSSLLKIKGSRKKNGEKNKNKKSSHPFPTITDIFKYS